MSTDLNFLLKRGVSEIISEEELTKLLNSGKKLRLKEGFDPSSTDIHMGHMVGLRKLRQFQDLGHQVVLIVGDWTAQIGDPSGASVTRPMLTAEKVKENAETYMKQFFRVVDREKTEVRWQSEWFGNFSLADVIKLTSKFTVAQFLAREDFNNRFKAGKPIAITEFMYPLLQAYDSVAVQSDVEFGGQDQKFNFLVGRELQTMMGQRPQQCFMTALLVGTDGVHKMSKSLGNYIGVDEAPDEIYGKVMALADNMIIQYFELLTDVSDNELMDFKRQIAGNTVNPMVLKKRLAVELVTQLHGHDNAVKADEHFTNVFQKREMPEEITEIKVAADEDIRDIITRANIAKSRSDATRLLQQGAISIDGVKLTSGKTAYQDGNIIKVGKHNFIKLVLQNK
ncbi:MAG TPA: tyrosine--tRNA ligase [Dehalococcoidales bacterium]|jgi:tyrosyl-tRNA synthetase|nr:tyrosine--tRNA ligase [Dehalococcoidales bacterium]